MTHPSLPPCEGPRLPRRRRRQPQRGPTTRCQSLQAGGRGTRRFHVFCSSTAVSIEPDPHEPDSQRRLESVDAVDNEFGIETYWNLWLRPADGGDRPLLAVVEDIPAKIESIVGGVESTVVPVEVEVVGRFFKRLAYRSSIGADLAPVIVGTLVVVSADASLTERAEVNQDVSSSRLIFGIALALLIGLGLAAITVWRTAVTARRARELRQSSSDRSATFLQRLSDIDEVDQDANERK